MDPRTSEVPFNPYDLRPLASLNKRRFIDLPGIDREWVGKTGWEYASTPALVQAIQPHVQDLGIENAEPERLNSVLVHGDRSARDLAVSIAAEHGRRLGYLIASIRLSPQGLTDPMVPWEQAYLQHWREHVRTIVLGGGRANGRLGEIICSTAQRALDLCGLQDLVLEMSEYPSYLPLIGLARSVPKGTPGAVVVTDFGSSRTKRGLAIYQGEQVHRLRVLPTRDIETWRAKEHPAHLATQMMAILSDTVGEADQDTALAPQILCSVAAYVEEGAPMQLDGGSYTSLHRAHPDVRHWFSQQLSQARGTPVQVTFYHDCCIAARALAGRLRTAVVMMGTALGVGFVPPADGIRPISDQFRLVEQWT